MQFNFIQVTTTHKFGGQLLPKPSNLSKSSLQETVDVTISLAKMETFSFDDNSFPIEKIQIIDGIIDLEYLSEKI